MTSPGLQPAGNILAGEALQALIRKWLRHLADSSRPAKESNNAKQN
jgi:hypothetical protein